MDYFEYIKNRNNIIIAGPCAVESKEQIITIAKELKRQNIDFLRGRMF